MKNKILLFVLLIPVILFSFRADHHNSVTIRSFNNDIEGVPYVVISKTKYELYIYDDLGWYATYPVVFGSKDLNDKMFEGDRRTPEGVFHIVSKRPHEKWGRMMLLDYPTKSDIEKFNQRKAQGLISASAKIGGGIGIHGTWPRDEIAVEKFQNWTNGCVSLKRDEILELYSLLPIGTKVTIKR